MPARNVVNKLAKLLNVPVEVIRAYARPRGRVSVAARRAKGAPKAEEFVYPKRDENEAYARWRDAPEEDKTVVTKELLTELKSHAEAVITTKLGRKNPALRDEIAAAAIENIGTFHGKARFSTWAHKLILNKVNMELRQRVKERQRFYFPKKPDNDPLLADPRAIRSFRDLEDRIALGRIERDLSTQEIGLLDCMLDDLTAAQIAEKLGIQEDAAESRCRRLVEKLQKQFAPRDGKQPV